MKNKHCLFPTAFLTLCLLGLFFSGCTPIPPKSIGGCLGNCPNLKVSGSGRLNYFDSIQAAAIENVLCLSFCKKEVLAEEISFREDRLHSRNTFLQALGAFLALANSIYNLANENPNNAVTATLGGLSGGTLATSFISLQRDNRVSVLRSQKENINLIETRLLGKLDEVNRILYEQSIVIYKLGRFEYERKKNENEGQKEKEEIEKWFHGLNKMSVLASELIDSNQAGELRPRNEELKQSLEFILSELRMLIATLRQACTQEEA